jgi:ribosomal protein S6
MEKDSQLYEMTYLISPALTDEEALQFHQTIKNAVLGFGGLIETEGDVKKQRLSYPIKKMTDAYVAWCRFTLGSDKIAPLQKNMEQPSVLRSLVVHTKPIPVRQIQGRVIKAVPVAETPTPKATRQREVEQPAVNMEEIDKKLEEILGA